MQDLKIKLGDFGISDRELQYWNLLGNTNQNHENSITVYSQNHFIIDEQANRGGRELDYHAFAFILVEIFLPDQYKTFRETVKQVDLKIDKKQLFFIPLHQMPHKHFHLTKYPTIYWNCL